MSRRRRRHVAAYRAVVRLMPPGHRVRHGEPQVQLFADLIDTGHSAWRLWVDALVDLFAVLGRLDRRDRVTHGARLALVPLSALGIVAGMALTTAAATADSVPVWVALAGAAMVVQGGYSGAWLMGGGPTATRSGRAVLLAGESVALLVGGTALAVAVAAQHGSADPEYGPITMLVIVVAHAIVGTVAGWARPSGGPASVAR